MIIKCDYCGRLFDRKPSWIKRNRFIELAKNYLKNIRYEHKVISWREELHKRGIEI